MGLDIRAYGKTVLVQPIDELDDYTRYGFTLDDNQTMLLKADFADASDDMQEGVYLFEEQTGFRAGSYRGYNEWRAILCQFAFGFEPETIWKDYEKYRGRPFARLICFSDCDGIIGTRDCKKLAKDFVEWESGVEKYFHNDKYFVDKYKLWKEAFLLAADEGFVNFG